MFSLGVIIKQIIAMRTDLNMRKGKMVAQGAHASMAAVLPYLLAAAATSQHSPESEKIKEWLTDSFTKVCVRVDSEEDLIALYQQAVNADLITSLITDNGLTEFGGVKTRTCVAIGPDTNENLEPVTGQLKLL